MKIRLITAVDHHRRRRGPPNYEPWVLHSEILPNQIQYLPYPLDNHSVEFGWTWYRYHIRNFFPVWFVRWRTGINCTVTLWNSQSFSSAKLTKLRMQVIYFTLRPTSYFVTYARSLYWSGDHISPSSLKMVFFSLSWTTRFALVLPFYVYFTFLTSIFPLSFHFLLFSPTLPPFFSFPF